jgi:DNA-binding transcriptional ArsR family regulator
MKKTIIAPVGDYLDDIFVAVRELPTEKVILISTKERLKQAEKTAEKLRQFKIPVNIVEVSGFIWEAMFKEVALLAKNEKGELIVNVSTGDRESRCAATSAAFVNGLKAFAVDGNNAMMLPTLKFSYYNMLSDKKLALLKAIYSCAEVCLSLEELSKKTGMSLPLISYHLNGTLKSKGLKEMELIETEESKGRTRIKLTFLGKMLLKGYIE